MMLQQDKPDDYVLATGSTRTVREFTELAFACCDRKIEWVGRGVEERGICSKTGRVLIEVSPEYFRPLEVDYLVGDASKARRVLGWSRRPRLRTWSG